MSDAVATVLILGAFVVPGYALIQVAERILLAVFESQSLLLALPFP